MQVGGQCCCCCWIVCRLEKSGVLLCDSTFIFQRRRYAPDPPRPSHRHRHSINRALPAPLRRGGIVPLRFLIGASCGRRAEISLSDPTESERATSPSSLASASAFHQPRSACPTPPRWYSAPQVSHRRLVRSQGGDITIGPNRERASDVALGAVVEAGRAGRPSRSGWPSAAATGSIGRVSSWCASMGTDKSPSTITMMMMRGSARRPSGQ